MHALFEAGLSDGAEKEVNLCNRPAKDQGATMHSGGVEGPGSLRLRSGTAPEGNQAMSSLRHLFVHFPSRPHITQNL